MKSPKLSKTDELVLLGDLVGAAKNELRKVRGIQTSSRRTLNVLDAAEAQGMKADAEIAHMREQLEHAIERAQQLETYWLEFLLSREISNQEGKGG